MSHLDIMRQVHYAIRRSGLKIDFSDGFNPHELIYFSPPTPVFTYSSAEYFCVQSNELPGKFIKELNKQLPDFLKVLKCNSISQNPNLAAISYAARYKIEFEQDIILPDFKEILSSASYQIEYLNKGEKTVKDVRDLILNLTGQGKEYHFVLLSGNKNLRADRLTEYMLTKIKQTDTIYKITKTNLYNNELKDFDEIFFKE